MWCSSLASRISKQYRTRGSFWFHIILIWEVFSVVELHGCWEYFILYMIRFKTSIFTSTRCLCNTVITIGDILINLVLNSIWTMNYINVTISRTLKVRLGEGKLNVKFWDSSKIMHFILRGKLIFKDLPFNRIFFHFSNFLTNTAISPLYVNCDVNVNILSANFLPILSKRGTFMFDFSFRRIWFLHDKS